MKLYEFETNLTNNISVSSVLGLARYFSITSTKSFQSHYPLVLAKTEIFLRINYLCAHAIFKVQIKADYTQSQAEVRNSNPFPGATPERD